MNLTDWAEGCLRHLPYIRFQRWPLWEYRDCAVSSVSGNLARAAIASENALAYIGVAALLISALLTAIYMLTVSVRAFFPGRDFDYSTIKDVEDPNWMMLLPLTIFAAAIIIFGLYSTPIVSALKSISALM